MGEDDIHCWHNHAGCDYYVLQEEEILDILRVGKDVREAKDPYHKEVKKKQDAVYNDSSPLFVQILSHEFVLVGETAHRPQENAHAKGEN